jgi:BMFP domain-containing protein YqiC
MENSFVRDLAGRLARNVPQGLQTAGADLERNFESVLQAAFNRLELVTREEFDVQRKLLQRSREKLDALQAELDKLQTANTAGKQSATD